MSNEKPAVTETPTLIQDLIGRRVRVVKPGDLITLELVPGRVTIHLTDDHRIEKIIIELGDPISI